MGVADAFDPALADLSGVADTAIPLYVSGAVQAAFVDAHEEGAEAAAVTAVATAGVAVRARAAVLWRTARSRS